MPKGWAYEGCIEESNGQRLLQGFAFSSGQTDQDNCASICGAMGFQYAGTQYANEVCSRVAFWDWGDASNRSLTLDNHDSALVPTVLVR